MPLPPSSPAWLLRAGLRRPLRSAPRPALRRPLSSPKDSKKPDDPIPVPNTIPPLPLWQRLGPLNRAAEAYARSQRTRPYKTQIASAIFIFLCADIGAQSIGGNDYDPVRSGRSMIIGATAAIPQYKWFFFLARNFNYSSRVLSIGTKVLVSQLFFAPLVSSYFFGMQVLLSGAGISATIERIKKAVPVSYVNSWKVWPAVTVVTLTAIPIEYRSLFMGFIAIGWQTYLTYLNRQVELREKAVLEQNDVLDAGSHVEKQKVIVS